MFNFFIWIFVVVVIIVYRTVDNVDIEATHLLTLCRAAERLIQLLELALTFGPALQFATRNLLLIL